MNGFQTSVVPAGRSANWRADPGETRHRALAGRQHRRLGVGVPDERLADADLLGGVRELRVDLQQLRLRGLGVGRSGGGRHGRPEKERPRQQHPNPHAAPRFGPRLSAIGPPGASASPWCGRKGRGDRRDLRLRPDRAEPLPPALRRGTTCGSEPWRTSPSRRASSTCSGSTRCSGGSPTRSRRRTGSSTCAGRRIPLITGKTQPPVPAWGELGVDTVLEATSRGRRRAELEAHLAGRREARDPARAAARAARRHDRPGRQRRGALGLAPHDLERLVDRALPRAGRSGSSTTPSASSARSSRRPLLHEPAPPRRRAGRGQAARPRRRREHHPAGVALPGDARSSSARARGTRLRLRDERPRPQRLGRRPRLLARAPGDARRDQRGPADGRRDGPLAAASSATRTSRSSPPTSRAPASPRRSTRSPR